MPVVIRLAPPLVVGCPVKYERLDEGQKQAITKSIDVGKFAKVPGYRIYISICSILDETRLKIGERKRILEEMALVFLNESVENHKFRYRQYVD